MPQDPEPSTITTRPPLAAIDAAAVQPPSRVYLGVDDRLYIRSRNSLAAVTLQVAGRLLTAEGIIVPFNFEHVPATDRTASLEAFRLAEGYLLSVVVFPSVGAPQRGQTFVELGLLRGRDVAAAVVDVLARDYVSEAEPLAFPGTPIRSSIEGPGVIRSITGTDPAAGVEVIEAVPTDARWKFKSMLVDFVTDATVSNRVVRARLDDGTNAYWSITARSLQSASLTKAYNLGPVGFWEAEGTSVNVLPLPPDVVLPAGHRILTSTVNFQAGDNWGAPQFAVEEWIQD